MPNKFQLQKLPILFLADRIFVTEGELVTGVEFAAVITGVIIFSIFLFIAQFESVVEELLLLNDKKIIKYEIDFYLNFF